MTEKKRIAAFEFADITLLQENELEQIRGGAFGIYSSGYPTAPVATYTEHQCISDTPDT